MYIIICIAGLIVVFASLCIVCDEHLVPAVEVFIKQFNVPEEVSKYITYLFMFMYRITWLYFQLQIAPFLPFLSQSNRSRR